MLEIDVAMAETYDEETNKIGKSDVHRVLFEHSLVSVSKWESFWKIPFLGKKAKTTEQTLSYVQMMIQGDQPPPEVFQKLLKDHLKEVMDYVEDKMSATTIVEMSGNSNYRETVTSELIYYWMVSMQVPIETEHWHFNRLITLIRIIGAKNSPKKKMNMADRRSLNQRNRARLGTRG